MCQKLGVGESVTSILLNTMVYWTKLFQDVILADRGFDIADSVGVMQGRLHIPAFINGKNQLSALDVHETRKIANVRIHVERVIGNVCQ